MKLGLAARTSALALAASMAAASAASAQTSVETLRDTILVTGTKKANAEDVQDVPLAITAYGEDQIDALKVRDLQSLSYSIPNVSFDDVGTTRGVANFSIRGLGINSSIPSIDPTVGVFVDGVYLGINGGVVLDIFDLESIEVLRGPQGILFGRNVTGGAVLLNSKKPSDEFEASFKGAAESGLNSGGPNFYAMAGVGGPIIEDVLKARVSVYYNKDEGYFRRYLGGPVPNLIAAGAFGAAAPLVATSGPNEFEDFGAAETWMVRPSISFTPTDDFELLLRYEHFDSNGDGPAGQNHTNGAGVTNPFFSASRDSFDFSIDEPGFYDTKRDAVTAEVNWNVPFGDGVITNIFGWRQGESETRSDIDATPLFLFHANSTTDQDQLSNELRYAGRFFDRIDLTVGGYWFTQDLLYNEQREIPLAVISSGSPYFSGGGVQDQVTYAAFGQADIDLNEQFTLILGGRWTYEKKEVVVSNLLANRAFPFCDVRIPGDCSEDFVDEDSWKNFTAKVGFEWRPREDLNVYGHFTQGVRSGGYNFRNTSAASLPFVANPAPPPAVVPNPAFDPMFLPGPFDEETVDAYEIGFKAQPADGKAVVNASFFYNDISDMQRELNLSDPLAGVVQVITNTADATIWGFEIETQIAFTDNFLFQGSLGRTQGSYDELLFDIGAPAVSPGVVDDADLNLEIPRLAPWTYGAGFIYSWDLGEMGSLDARARYFHRDASFYTDNNLGTLNEYDAIDASISLTTFDNRATISLYGKNLLNEVQFGGDTQLPGSLGGGSFAPLQKGRIVGIELQLATN
ncbi:MAG: hypothetical protein CMI63_00975 [Parvularcula sp.]|nr:hypothetical protein [Parvularcula sp.]